MSIAGDGVKGYRAGIITIKAIAQKCHCTRQAIEKRAKAEGWTRNLQSSIRKVASEKQLKSSIAREATNPPEPDKQSVAPHTVSAPVAPAGVHAREEEARDRAAAYHPSHEREDAALVEAAAREIVSVTQAHRVEAARLIGITRDLGGNGPDMSGCNGRRSR